MLPSFDILEKVAAAYHTSVDHIWREIERRTLPKRGNWRRIFCSKSTISLTPPSEGLWEGIAPRQFTRTIKSPREIAKNPKYKKFTEKLFGTLKGVNRRRMLLMPLRLRG